MDANAPEVVRVMADMANHGGNGMGSRALIKGVRGCIGWTRTDFLDRALSGLHITFEVQFHEGRPLSMP
jgi:hypothetical protein